MKKIIILGVGDGPLPLDILRQLKKGFEGVGEQVEIVDQEDFLNAVEAEKAMGLRKCSEHCDQGCAECNKNIDEELENFLASMGFVPKTKQPYDGYGFKVFEELYGVKLDASAIELVKLMTDIKKLCNIPNVELIHQCIPPLMVAFTSATSSSGLMQKTERLFQVVSDYSRLSERLARDITALHEAFNFKRRMAGYSQS